MMSSWIAARSARQWLVLMLCSGFIFTFGYALHFHIKPEVDARNYDEIATNIAAGNGYRVAANQPFATDAAIGSVGPAYEYFLGSLFFVFGHNLAVVWCVQTLLYVITALLLFLITARSFGADGERMGLIAAGLYLFFIDIIQMPAMLMTETLYLFFLVLTVYLFVRFYQCATYTNAALFGFASALAVMTRPTALLILALGMLLALTLRRYWQAALMLLCAALLIAPWTIRNYHVYDRFILTTAAGGYDLWMGNNPDADGGARVAPEIAVYTGTHTFSEIDAYGTQQAEAFVIHHPLQFVRLLAWKASAYFSIARPYGFWFYLHGLAQKIVLAWSALWSFVLFVLGCSGAWLLWKKREPLSLWLLALAALMPLSVIPIIVETRYRLPLYPFLALFGGYFTVRLYSIWEESNTPALKALLMIAAVVASLFLADAAFDVSRNLPLILGRLGGL